MRLFGKKRPAPKDLHQPSLRLRCFELFRQGQRPGQVCKTVPVSLRTACRYFEDFKKLHHWVPYRTIRRWVRENPEFSEKVITLLATHLDMPPEAVISRLEKPWGLYGALRGAWPNFRLERERSELEARLLAALEVVKFAEVFGRRDPEFVRATIRQLILEKGEEPSEPTPG